MINERKLILQKLEEVAPEHINGYLNGWLHIEHYIVEEICFIHICTILSNEEKSIIAIVSY